MSPAIRRLLRNAAPVVLITILLWEAGARIVLSSAPEQVLWYDASAQLKIDQMDDLARADVVFAGTSMAWQAFDPESFTESDAEHRPSYNAALNGGVPGVMSPWLLDQVVPRLQPTTVVWGLSSLDLAVGYGDLNVEAYQTAFMTRSGFLAAFDRVASRYSVLVAERPLIRDPSRAFGFEADAANRTWTEAQAMLGSLGQRLDFTERLDDDTRAVETARLADYETSVEDVSEIVATINALKARNINVVLVNLPIPDRYVGIHSAGFATTELVASTIAAIAELTEVELIDTQHALADADFVDFTHVKQAAAQRFTRAVQILMDGDSTTDDSSRFFGAVPELVAEFERLADGLGARPSNGQQSTSFFFNAEDLGRMREIVRLRAESTPIDTVLVGTSQMRNAGDSISMTEDLDVTVMNLALSGAGPEMWESYLLDRLVDTAGMDRVVWGVGALDLAGTTQGCTFFNGRLEALGVALDQQDLAFSAMLRADESPLDVLVEMPSTSPSAAFDYYDTWFGELGDQTLNTDRNFASDAPNYPAASQDYSTCPQRYEALERTIAQLDANGVAVVVVGMPTPARRLEVYRDGIDIDEAMQTLGAQVEQAGGQFIDLTRALPDEMFRDYAHVNAVGAQTFSSLLSEFLESDPG